MDGENDGKPYEQMDDLEGKPTIFGNTSSKANDLPRAEHYLLDVLRSKERAHSRSFSDAWGAQGNVGVRVQWKMWRILRGSGLRRLDILNKGDERFATFAIFCLSAMIYEHVDKMMERESLQHARWTCINKNWPPRQRFVTTKSRDFVERWNCGTPEG